MKNKTPMQIFQEMQSLETKAEMIDYLRQLPREEEDANYGEQQNPSD